MINRFTQTQTYAHHADPIPSRLLELAGTPANKTLAKYYAGRKKNKKKVQNALRQWERKFDQLAKTSRRTGRQNLAGTASHEAGHAKITWSNSPRKFLKAKVLNAKSWWTLHSGPDPKTYTRRQMKRLMVLAVAGKAAELKAVGHSTCWEDDKEDWRRVATKLAVTSARWAEIEGEE
ncbi:hypothetical protein niasHS_000092 [Heterodera schachtii]|uniref:Uncharacterized protein n=1 Tax=Heterodera schachtii TaxID=97005 RepID=A0ABD2KM64_HETSC